MQVVNLNCVVIFERYIAFRNHILNASNHSLGLICLIDVKSSLSARANDARICINSWEYFCYLMKIAKCWSKFLLYLLLQFCTLLLKMQMNVRFQREFHILQDRLLAVATKSKIPCMLNTNSALKLRHKVIKV